MPTISGAIIQAAAFQATSGPSTFQAVTASGKVTISAVNGEVFKVTAAAGGTDGASAFVAWYRADGSTRRGYFGVATSSDPNMEWVNENATGSIIIRTNSIAAVTISSSQAVTVANTLTTGAPTGGAGAWKLGVANVVTPTSPNRTIAIDIGGTVYYLHAKTTNN